MYSDFYDVNDEQMTEVAEFSDGWEEMEVTISSPKRKREKKRKAKKENTSKKKNARRLLDVRILARSTKVAKWKPESL